jgi:serine phosphatase RsbU (regulator of sigma subunit)
VTSARNSDEEQFGDERLMEFLREARSMRPEEMVDALIQRVREFSGPGKPTDDITAVVMLRS